MPRPVRLAFLVPLALAAGLAGQRQDTFAAVEDAFVDSSKATTNLGANGTLIVSDFTILVAKTTRHALVRFDLRSIPRTAAVLDVFWSHTEVAKVGTPVIRMFRVLKPWSEGTVTFTNRPSILSTPVFEGELRRNPEPVTALRSLVQEWVANPASNVGLMLSTDAKGFGEERLEMLSKEAGGKTTRAPKLIVTFTSVEIVRTPLPDGVVGLPYNAKLRATTNGVETVAWEVLGKLPNGITTRVVANELLFSGTPTEPFDGQLTAVAKDLRSPTTDSFAVRLAVRAPTGGLVVGDGAPGLRGGSFTGETPVVALVPEVRNESPAAVLLESLTVLVAGPGDNARHLAGVAVFSDDDSNGELDATDTRLAAPVQFTGDNEPVAIALTDARILAQTTRQLLVVLLPRADCPAGAEFAVAIAGADFAKARFVIGAAPAAVTLGKLSLLQGPVSFAGDRQVLAADADRDGRIDVRDAQIFGRRLGDAPADLPDPDANGSIGQEDVDLVLDFILRRPALVAVPQSTEVGALVTLRGFELGLGDDGIFVLVDQQKVALLFSTDTEKVFRVPAELARAEREVRVSRRGQESRPRKLSIR